MNPPRFIDTHCHFDFPPFLGEEQQSLRQAAAAGIERIVVPSVAAARFADVLQLAERHPMLHAALGLHPIAIEQHQDADVDLLEQHLRQHRERLTAVGEIGLDTYIAKKLNYGYTDFMSYSIDFRRRILSIKKHEGLSIRETAKRFHIGTTTIVRWTKQIDARPATSRQRKIDKSALERDVEQYPDAYQRERAERFGVCQMVICKALKKLQLTYKKNSASSKSRRRR